MKRKADIQKKIDLLWDEYNQSVTKVAEMSWDKTEMNDILLKGMFAYKQLSVLEWVLDNSSVGEI
ncbi:MAG: hypothetical protein WBP57_09420 [Ignavibacteria bacterium]